MKTCVCNCINIKMINTPAKHTLYPVSELDQLSTAESDTRATQVILISDTSRTCSRRQVDSKESATKLREAAGSHLIGTEPRTSASPIDILFSGILLAPVHGVIGVDGENEFFGVEDALCSCLPLLLLLLCCY